MTEPTPALPCAFRLLAEDALHMLTIGCPADDVREFLRAGLPATFDRTAHVALSNALARHADHQEEG